MELLLFKGNTSVIRVGRVFRYEACSPPDHGFECHPLESFLSRISLVWEPWILCSLQITNIRRCTKGPSKWPRCCCIRNILEEATNIWTSSKWKARSRGIAILIRCC